MSRYKEMTIIAAGRFRRLPGVKRATFQEMVNILLAAQASRYRVAGRKGKLTIEDRLLMALPYISAFRQ